jgi:hypothetical protein
MEIERLYGAAETEPEALAPNIAGHLVGRDDGPCVPYR